MNIDQSSTFLTDFETIQLKLFSDQASGPTICNRLLTLLPRYKIDLIPDMTPLLPQLLADDTGVLLIDLENLPESVVESSLSEIKKHFSPERLPVVVLCQSDSIEKRNAALAYGAHDYLNLPLDASETAIRINNALAFRQCFKTYQVAHDNLEKEVATRTAKLNLLIDSCLMMAMEKSRERLLDHILREGQKLLHCDGGTLYMVTPEHTLLFAQRTRQDLLPFEELTLRDPVSGLQNDSYASTYAANHNTTVVIDDVYQEMRFDCSGTRQFDSQTGYRTVSLLTVPMAPRGGNVIGILQFINALDAETGRVIAFPKDVVSLVEALAAQAAVAVDNLKLIEGQKAATESIIRVLADAIDTKSPHTGHHCVRVPELAIMLAEAACRQTEGPLAEFNFASDDEWLEFRVGAWLHDCGKITVPEYVIEKATKLDMLYNRIHEIRMRFEVLLRDAEIMRLEDLLHGGDEDKANLRFERQKAELADDFSFLAQCNMGREHTHGHDVERIKRIAAKTWLRHYDDCIGLSQQDMMRLSSQIKPELPVLETLLSDKPEHIIPRNGHKVPAPSLGIKMVIPEHLYNYGEIYNLSIQKGTLNVEDRYKINEHIIETINLLEKVNFPDFLRRVPEYATTHHETLDGRGYPRKLTAKDLSIPARIMAVADIFEAITASDRPYKKPYTLSQALTILLNMKNNNHIDADVFKLFLESGVYKVFAEKYLLPEQIDEVNIQDFLLPDTYRLSQ